ncbi:MAG: aminotransferase class I/II-fold pyridoxal phosphate-dependent enzyme [Christensenellales bacterium]|jgi:LL-diaminopimelate aminotransferase
MEFSYLMKRLESGIFTELAKEKASLINIGIDVIDLSVGTPNIPPAQSVKQTIAREAEKNENYVYAIEDLDELKSAASVWYKQRYGVDINSDSEVCAVLGSQEGLAHCCLPVINPGDTVILQDPCYPAFYTGAALAHADIYWVPQRPENGFIIDFDDIPKDIAQKAKLMIVSYPNNPTTAVAPASFYQDLIAFARQNEIFIIHDNAYSELTFDGLKGGSFLAFEGAKQIGAEFNSLSKSFGFAGARLGFCLGNSEYIRMLKRLKSNTDYGIFIPVQKAGICALNINPIIVANTAKEYEKRRDVLIKAFQQVGWDIERPKATMFVWAQIPVGFDSDVSFCKKLAQSTGVIVVPGSAFGSGGKGYVRMALVQSEDRIRTAAQRIGRFLSQNK